MTTAATSASDEQLIDQLRRAAYTHFGRDDLLALEEILRRYARRLDALRLAQPTDPEFREVDGEC